MRWTPISRGVTVMLCFLLSTSAAIAQQSSKPLDGQPWDLGAWGSGGFSVPGGTQDTHMIDAGLRLGKVLTDDAGPGILRGNFEWAADVIPVYYIWQPAPAKNAYAAGFNPVNLKWNFTRCPHNVPFFELGGGVLFSNTEVPLNTSTVNFATHAAVGFHFLNSQKRAFTASVRYEHISNAGLSTPNPGINTVQFLIGMNWFK